MKEISFNYEGNIIIVQCNYNDKIKDIIEKFKSKYLNLEENLYYLYNGNKINYESTFFELANDFDKNRNKMDIIIKKNDENKNEIISKDIICPECKENILIDIKDFKVNLYGCKNNHKNIILLNKFEETQKICLSKIFCDECKNQNKGNFNNNEFYYCSTCNKNICPLCKTKHDKNHIMINYDDKNYICNKHNEPFIKYLI